MRLSKIAPWLLAALIVGLAALFLAGPLLFSPSQASNSASPGSPSSLAAPNGASPNPALETPLPWDPNSTWQKPSDAQLKAVLSPLQYEVTQRQGTEPAFNNEYWDNHADGIYVDIVSGQPLFSSRDKFDSGTGWPSFTKPIGNSSVTTRADYSLGIPRTEVRSSLADSHLGHLFDDGPPPTYLRYCMNSAALRFVPKGQMAALGYGAYLGELNAS